jgi:hypothetical protein
VRHKAVRIWWRPWQKRCTCGCRWHPCPDSITMNAPAFHPAPARNEPDWNSPTVGYINQRPLLTRGQEWRSRRGPNRIP